MDDLDVLKAEIEDPKNAEAISRLESEMQRYVVRKKKFILEHHAKRYPGRTDEQSYAHSIIQYFALVDRCCMDADTEIRIQLGRAMRDTLSKLEQDEEVDIDDFVVACLKEKNLGKLIASFKEHAEDISRCLTERDRAVDWRDDYMMTVALLFDRKKNYFVALLRYDPGTTPSSSLSLPSP